MNYSLLAVVEVAAWDAADDLVKDGRIELRAELKPVGDGWWYSASGSRSSASAWRGTGSASACLRAIAHAWQVILRAYYLREEARQRVIKAIEAMPAVIISSAFGEEDGRGWMLGELRGELIDRHVGPDGRPSVSVDDVLAAIRRCHETGYPAGTWCPAFVLEALKLVEDGVDGALEILPAVRAEARSVWDLAGSWRWA